MTNFEKVKITIFATIIVATVFWFYPRAQAPEPPPEMVIICVTGAPLPTEPQEPSFEPYDIPLDASLQEHIDSECKHSGIPTSLALAVIWQESKCKSDAVGSEGEIGLMQIHPCNFDKADRARLFEPEQNIQAGINILSQAIEQTDNLHQALMAYNIGMTGAKREWAKGLMSTGYSRSVLEKMNELEAAE